MVNAPATILVVDDEALLRGLATDILADEGYRILQARDAADALHVLADDGAVSLLFTDIDTPGERDGMALAVEARRRCPAMGIILTSGVARPGLSAVSPRGGFLPKPYRAQQLAADRLDARGPMAGA